MKIVTAISNQPGADYVLITISPGLANWLMDAHHLFRRNAELADYRPLIWASFADTESAVFFNAQMHSYTGFERYRPTIEKDGYAIVPDFFDPPREAATVAADETPPPWAVVLQGDQMHLIITDEGVSWNGRFQNFGRKLVGTRNIPWDVVNEAAGIHLPT